MARILLVDDETIVRTLLAVALKRRNHEVLEASTGRQALRLARRSTAAINLLVTELALPRMNGLDLAAEVSQIHSEVKALFVSRSPHPVLLENKARESGFTVLRKPFDLAALLGEVARRVESASEARKPAGSSSKRRAATRRAADSSGKN